VGDDEAQDGVIEVRVGGIVVDPESEVPVVLLRAVEDERLYLPIFIGGLEATAIATVLAQVELPRPMTHDLMVSLLVHVDVRVDRVTVTRLEEGTFYAEIALFDPHGGVMLVDARPSDSIALALRVGAPIYVARAVMAEAGALAEAEPSEAPAAADPEAGTASDADLARGPAVIGGDDDVRLEDLEAEDFGKYKM